jgi:hypothetical protein
LSGRRTAVAAATLASLAAACQLIAGIKDHRFDVEAIPDEGGASDVSTPDAPLPPDPCAHTTFPPRPDAGFDDIKGTYTFAVRTVDFSGADDAGAPLGFDLDHVCTCDHAAATAHLGVASCTPPGPTPCDYEGGIDNALYKPFKDFGGFLGSIGTGTALLGDQAECGRETLLLVVADYNGLADDSLVKVGLIPSFGVREPHDGGEVPDSSCTTSPDPPYPAKWDGTDVWSFAEGTAIRRGPDVFPVVSTSEAYVTGYRLIVPPVRSVTLFLGAQTVEVSSPAAVATLVGIDAYGKDVPAGAPAAGFRIADGVLGGRIAVGALLAALGQFKPKAANGEFLCNYPLYAIPLKQQVCADRDILSDPVKDFLPTDVAPFACDAVSTAVRFTGQMAQVGDVYSPDAGQEGGCAPDWTVCP